MEICDRLRELRELRNLTQRDIEKSTGLLSAYISRVEHGHTVPTVPTLEKFARALGVPIYRLFLDGEPLPMKRMKKPPLWGSSGKDAELLSQFRQHLSRIREEDRQLLVDVARKLAKEKAARAKRQFDT
jgi:transcriptional regulator with XRE-family HTH domain